MQTNTNGLTYAQWCASAKVPPFADGGQAGFIIEWRAGYDPTDYAATRAKLHYWTVLVPYVERENRTEWHPTQSDGPFAVLTRGMFASESKAIEWARANLNGTPYTLRRVTE